MILLSLFSVKNAIQVPKMLRNTLEWCEAITILRESEDEGGGYKLSDLRGENEYSHNQTKECTDALAWLCIPLLKSYLSDSICEVSSNSETIDSIKGLSFLTIMAA